MVADDAGARARGITAAELAVIALPVVMASLDVVENSCIAAMLWTWPDLSPGLVHVSSIVTRAKIIAGVLTEILMTALAVTWLVRWRWRHRA